MLKITLEDFNILVSNCTFDDGRYLDKDMLYIEIYKHIENQTKGLNNDNTKES